MRSPPRITLVILSCNRADELRRTVEHALELPERPPIIVVDNGSADGAGRRVAAAFRSVRVLQLPRNLGACARNEGARLARTPYIAFSDDDTIWTAGSLARAQVLLDRYPSVAVLCGRVLVGAHRREDPVCAAMARSPLPSAGLPGPRLLGFLAGASAVRRDAFLAAGGYTPRFFIGGEEELLALDLLAAGWSLAYAPQLTILHFPSAQRERRRREQLLLRNRLWTAWMRRAPSSALAATARAAQQALLHAPLRPALYEALRGLPWALARRRPLPPCIEAWCARIEAQSAAVSATPQPVYGEGRAP